MGVLNHDFLCDIADRLNLTNETLPTPANEKMGLGEITGLFRIEIDDGGVNFDFPGWLSADDESSHLTLVQDIP
jgi:hypothetical protein